MRFPGQPRGLVKVATNSFTRELCFGWAAGQQHDLVSHGPGVLYGDPSFSSGATGRTLTMTANGFIDSGITFTTNTAHLHAGPTDPGVTMLVVLDSYGGAAGTATDANLMGQNGAGLGVRNSDHTLFMTHSLTRQSAIEVPRNQPTIVATTFKYGVGNYFYVDGAKSAIVVDDGRAHYMSAFSIGGTNSSSITAGFRAAFAWNRVLSDEELALLARNPWILVEPKHRTESRVHVTAAGGATTKSVSITLVTSPTNETARASLSSLKWAYFDEVTPDLFNAPVHQGDAETTDGDGVLTISVPDSTKANGEIGYLIVTDSDGTTSQSPSANVFAGPVPVTVA